MHAEIIAVGDEITSGQLLDTNTQWLSVRLEELGVRVLYHSTVGDELEPCAEVFRQAIARADVVVVTGGLGPTADDLTRESLARATGRELCMDADALEGIRTMFARRNRPMTPSNARQAMFPVGSCVVGNRHGTAPGIDLEVPRDGKTPCRVFCLPGVPSEMFQMWDEAVAPAISRLGDGARRIIRRRRINCFGAGESQVEAMLPDLIRRGRRPTVGITAGKYSIILRIAAEGQTEEECRAAIEPVAAMIRQSLGTLVFGEDDEELQHAVVKLLRERGKTLATAECGTDGLMAEWLSDVDGSADVYRGGLVLGEPAESVDAMACRCREQFGADYGLAILLPSLLEKVAEGGPSPLFTVALADAEGVRSEHAQKAYHPALARIHGAKHTLNFARLAIRS